MNTFNRMDKHGNAYFISQRTPFSQMGVLSDDTICRVFNFAYEMTFGGNGEHRNHRSGGSLRRSGGEIFANAFQGKLGECAIYEQLQQEVNISEPDFSTYGLGEWDSVDFSIDEYKLSVKSTKSFGNLLLLETDDWDVDGRYVPNNQAYDFTFLVRLRPYCEDILRRERMLYTDSVDRSKLINLVLGQRWEYDIPGFITLEDLQYVIRNNFILPKNSLLNGKISMDADNYYIQSGDMHPLEDLLWHL